MNTKQKVGSAGERIATNHLRKQGYSILGRNFKIRYPKGPWCGEIDIITKKKGVIHFIEVKTARKEFIDNAFAAEGKVGAEKRARLIKAAQLWLAKHEISQDSKWQIDIIAVYGNDPDNIRIFENITF